MSDSLPPVDHSELTTRKKKQHLHMLRRGLHAGYIPEVPADINLPVYNIILIAGFFEEIGIILMIPINHSLYILLLLCYVSRATYRSFV